MPAGFATTAGRSVPTARVRGRRRVRVRRAAPAEAGAIAAIYNQGVEERVATFQAEPVDAAAFAARIEAGELFLVAEADGAVFGAAWVSEYEPAHDYYAGVGEATLYVE